MRNVFTTDGLTPLWVILGPTASGKTSLAVNLARRLDGEILSADSRQVYRGMDIGSGKDLNEYTLSDPDGSETVIPHHLIDVAEAGEEYNLFRYQQAFDAAYADICTRRKTPVLCGGSGLYLAAALGKKTFREVPCNTALRTSLQNKSDEELAQLLASYGPLHNHTDTETRERCLRALEIAEFEKRHPAPERIIPEPKVFGIRFEPEALRERIRIRLRERLENGMTEEVKALLDSGLNPEQLTYYGLEYKYLTLYITGKMERERMERELYFSICQFAKRQRTWFRKMEREGCRINWIDGNLPLEEKLQEILK
ncbi:MAG: tRNA (adenosine(37)-N6)-dimethylallyltransferase MiaA [Bacteroides sp.]|nr:tRNA (adenosine(37)-N6)-dimethylallyltransferase MiaA [Bacteroides sp.]